MNKQEEAPLFFGIIQGPQGVVLYNKEECLSSVEVNYNTYLDKVAMLHQHANQTNMIKSMFESASYFDNSFKTKGFGDCLEKTVLMQLERIRGYAHMPYEVLGTLEYYLAKLYDSRDDMAARSCRMQALQDYRVASKEGMRYASSHVCMLELEDILGETAII